MGERSYLSIGDVLALLREEFPDITISKIRFLESRGLLVPERTPSGYRKFYDHDVDRLRWILRQQREHFLPLKVIKGRLEGQVPPSEPAVLFEVQPVGSSHTDVPDEPPSRIGEGVLEPVLARNGSHGMLEGSPAASAAVVGHSQSTSTTQPAASGLIGPRPQSAPSGHPGPVARVGSSTRSSPPSSVPAQGGTQPATPTSNDEHRRASSATGRRLSEDGAEAVDHDPVHRRGEVTAVGPSLHAAARAAGTAGGASARGSGRASGGGAPVGGAGQSDRDLAVAASDITSRAGSDTAGGGSAVSLPSGRDDGPGDPQAGADAGQPDATSLSGASLTAAELAQASGLDVNQVAELEAYGLIESRTVAGVYCYDEEALVVAGLAAGFARFGVEARHLKLFKHAAERQASLYSQVVMPLLRQRNPDARRRAHDDLSRLSELGASMQACFAKAVLRDLTRG